MIANHGSLGKPWVANSTYSRIAAYRSRRILSLHGLTPCWATSDNLNKQTVALDWPCPENGAICYNQGRHALNSTWDKSKSKTKRNLATECRRKDVGERNQLIRAEEEGKRQATLPWSSHGLKVLDGTKRIEWVPSQIVLVQRIRNFVHYELLGKWIFQNLRKTTLITYFVKISMSAAYFASLSLVRCIRNFGHYKTQEN